MARLWKTAPALLIAFVIALAVACGGGSDKATKDVDDSAGGDGAATSDDPLGAPSDPIVGNVTEALGASVETFETEVNSVRAEYMVHIEAPAMTMDVSGDFAYQAPDELWMTLAVDGGSFIDFSEFGTFEILSTGGDFYVNVPFLGGWFVMSAEELGADFDSFGSLMEGHSPFDYAQLVEAFGDSVEDLGEESLDGGVFRHVRVTIDAADAFAAFSETFSDADAFGFTEVEQMLNGPMVVDLWVHPDSFLPHQIEASASFDVNGEATAMMMSMSFSDYNETVDIPAPPDSAQSFVALFEGLFEEGFDETIELEAQ
jgi:hypothetical protein